MSKAPQTEAEERASVIHEYGWLAGKVLDLTGHFPSTYLDDRDRGFEFATMSTREIAALCQAIRDEFPALDLGAP